MIAALLLSLLGAPVAAANPGSPSRSAAADWLRKHPTFYALRDQDCRCDSDLVEIRTHRRGVWKANPAYHPFAVEGDFNGDGRKDAAIVVGDRQLPGKRWVLILTAQQRGSPTPFLSRPFGGTSALFYGPPRPRPYRLIVGNFETEGVIFISSGNGKYVVR